MIYLFPFLAVAAGWAVTRMLPALTSKNLKLLLAFSGAFLLSLTIFHILPEVYAHFRPILGILVLAGLFLQIVLEFFSKGAEHGHVHQHRSQKIFPWALFLSLSLHAFTEGIPVEQHQSLLWGIVVHKLPVAAILALFLSQSGLSKTRVYSFLFLFALMTPLGTLVSEKLIGTDYQVYFSALVIGIFLHISTTILFETTEGHKFNLAKIMVVLLGFALAFGL